jgi:excisionase family DNA binding protein
MKKKKLTPTELRADSNAMRLTMAQAAMEVPCSRRYLDLAVMRKELSVIRLGRKILVPRKSLEKFLQEHTT